MIALLASYVLVVFILVPGVLFKLSFSLWIRPRRFQRTRTEEITYAVVIALIPLVATGLIVWNLDWPGKHPFPFEDSVAQKHTDYKLVFQAAYSERFFDDNRDAVWQAAGRVSLRQRRFLFWFYILTVIEARTVGTLSRYYGRMRHMPLIGRPYAWFADKLLLPHVSEWHILFTPFLFRPGERRIVKVDVLTTGDQLYGGTIGDHFIDTSGELTAIFLKDAQRFDRRTYLQDKDRGNVSATSAYWKPIPGANLCIFAEKIVNVNLRYETEIPHPELIADLLRRLNLSVTVEEVPSDKSENTAQPDSSAPSDGYSG